MQMRKNLSLGVMTQNNFEKSARLAPVAEAHNYISQNENAYYKSNRIF